MTVTLYDPCHGLMVGMQVCLNRRPRWRIVRAWRWFRSVVLRRPHRDGPYTVIKVEDFSVVLR